MTNDDNYGPWIDWKGGECPIPDAEAWTFELRFRGGEETPSTIAAKKWIWANDKPTSADIIAYRVRLPADDLLRQAIEALRPFAEVAERDIGESETDAEIFRPMGSGNNRVPLLTVGDLRKAIAVLAAYDARAAKEQS